MQAAGTIRTTEQRQSQANKASKRLCLLNPRVPECREMQREKCEFGQHIGGINFAGQAGRALDHELPIALKLNEQQGLLVPRAHGLNLRTWRVTRITCCATCATLLGSLRWSSNVGKKRFLMRLPNSFFVVLWDIWRYVLFLCNITNFLSDFVWGHLSNLWDNQKCAV